MFDERGSRKYLNQAERFAFFKTAMSEPNTARRAFALTLLYTGCRISEALNMKCERVDRSQKSVVFETMKQRQRGLFRAVPIPGTLSALLGQLIFDADHSSRVWRFSRASGYRVIKGYMIEAKINGAMASPKGLRHGFAVACVGKNIPLTTVQKWMGHARLETTSIYLGVSGDEEREFARRLWFRQ